MSLDAFVMRCWFLWWGSVALVLARKSLVPARIIGVDWEYLCGGNPALLHVRWIYSEGVRPRSVIVDLVHSGGRASATVGYGICAAVLPLATPLEGTCEVSLSATYRSVGPAYTLITRVSMI
ncbi:hypothetical protein [Candidatus Chloroploca asiatica]|uniref:Secreted protein n=1 Tax=Candidatus Chloroploca asiatica TaxID=1506545 RepID=A0A2H3L8V2_9CHLR|nr:hypothetical protein [Candidatus Chloroploca asiatica]PDV99750.1 hypothetical protein A9Q02_00600 [Candidatus Chloroploca asiatica]